MFKNVATKIAVFAFDTTTGLGKGGDAANLTVYVSKDFGTVTAVGDTSATEMDSTNAKGWYLFDLTQAETNGDFLLFTGKSTTTAISVVGQPIYTVPNRFSSLVIDAAGLMDANAVKVGPSGAGTAQTARDIGASVLISSGTGTGQLSVAAGVIAANVTHFGGTAGTFASGVPEVNAVRFAGQVITAAGGVTLPSTVASPTNITAGTITTVTNLTNAATAGDFTATMKTSIGTAVAASAVASVTGNVGGSVASVTGAVGSVTGSVGSVVGLTASNLDATISSRASAANLAVVAGYIDTEIGDIQSRLPAALVGGRMDSSVGAMAANVMTAAAAASDLTTELQSGLATAANLGLVKAVTDKLDTTLTGAAGSPGEYQFTADALELAPSSGGGGGSGPSAAAIADAVWDEVLSGHVAAGSAGAALAGTAAESSLLTVAGYVDTEVAAIKAKTDLIPASPAAVGDVPTATQNADALLDRDMAAGTDTGSPTKRTVRQALRILRNKWTITSSTQSVKKEDDSTESWSQTLVTTPGADPVTGTDPA